MEETQEILTRLRQISNNAVIKLFDVAVPFEAHIRYSLLKGLPCQNLVRKIETYNLLLDDDIVIVEVIQAEPIIANLRTIDDSVFHYALEINVSEMIHLIDKGNLHKLP